MLHRILIYKNYTKWKKLHQMKKKYTKLNNEIFYTKLLTEIKKWTKRNHEILFKPSFYFNKVAPYSEKITRKTKNCKPNSKIFTPNQIFFCHIRRLLHETLKFLHKIRNILHQIDCTFGFLQISYIFMLNRQDIDHTCFLAPDSLVDVYV